jgi:hypothetical protein
LLHQERKLEFGLREVFSDPLPGADAVPEAETAALAGSSPTGDTARRWSRPSKIIN